MRTWVYLTGLLMFAFGTVHAQDATQLQRWRDSSIHARDDTSRINYLREISKSFLNAQPDSAIVYCCRAIAFSRKIGWLKGEAQNLLNLGAALTNQSKYDSAILVEGQALDASIKLGDQNRIALIYINRSSAYIESFDFEKALADLKQALKIAEATGNKERKARAAQSLTEFYMTQENFSAALPWAEMALQLQEEIGDSAQQIVSMLNLGGLYTSNKLFPKAEKMMLETARQSREQNRPDVYIECARTLSDIYLQKRQPDKAIAYLDTALVYAHRMDMKDREASLCLNLGNSYLQKNEYEKALQIFRDGVHSVENTPVFKKDYYQCLFGEAESLSLLKRYAEAYDQSALATRIKDSFVLQTQNERVSRLQMQFGTERREAEIALLIKDKELASIALQRQKSIRIATSIIAALIIGIVLLIVARYRAVQRTRQLLQMEKLRQSISRDLHDDMGSTLSSIHINSRVALDHPDNLVLVKDKLDTIRSNAGKMMQGMSDIVWAINPANDSLEKLIIRMKEFSSEMLEPLNISIHFKETLRAGGSETGLQKRKEIFMIYKEILNNAAKYSEAENVWIDVQVTKERFFLRVADDGKGFDHTTASGGNGLKNMTARTNSMLGKLEVQSAPAAGTKITLEVPLP